MLRYSFLFSALFLVACKSISNQPNVQIRQELLDLVKADQVAMGKSEDEKAAVLRSETARLKEIIKKHGWPGISLVGKDGAQAAWLLAQHADFDLPFQKSVLTRMEKLSRHHDVNLNNLAYLQDRVAINDGKLQIYGTQGSCNGKTYEPFPLRDPERVDELRAKMELNPLRDYAAFASRAMCSGK